MARMRIAFVSIVSAGSPGASPALAAQEFPPPQGTGPVVMLASGMSGPDHYTAVAKDIAAMGYDVVLFDGNAMGVAMEVYLKPSRITPAYRACKHIASSWTA